jgi:2-oxo-4-hydroxy-4-carboxy-5-ureidoimidazoline decarboxylase
MLASRPWRERAAFLAASERAWAALSPGQLAEAIARHPRLGETRAVAALGARERRWSAAEQAGAGAASDDVRAALARGNVEYERRFGHTFILCASGSDAEQMLAALRVRLGNSPEAELAITARELEKITTLRLEKLLAGA